jgi:four helix bundle protein
VLGRIKAEPRAARGRSLCSRALIRPARDGRGLRSSNGEGRRLTMSLKIYPVVLELVRRLAPVVRVLRARSAALGDQMERALISVPLNVAEGAYSRGRNRQARFQSAAASARETLACLETAEAMGFIGPIEPELVALFNRVIGTLVRLVEPRG